MSTNKLWSDEEEQKLRQLWDKKLSCAQIGSLIGREKNAVIGKAHRLDLPMRGFCQGFLRKPKIMTPGTHTPKQRPNRHLGGHALSVRKARSGPKLVLVPAQPELPLPPSCKPVAFIDITPFQCHYVIGEANGPDTQMCGSPSVKRNYCAYHHSICWHPMPKKKATAERGEFVLPRVGIAA